MPTIVANGRGESVTVENTKEGILLTIESEVWPNSGSHDCVEIIFPQDRVLSLLAALEDESGV